MKSKKERLHPIARGFLPALVLFIFLVSLSPVLAQRDDPENIPPPDSVIIAGTLQSALGCPGDWNTQCEDTLLVYDADSDLWTATFDMPAGSYEYKAALNGTWDDNYGLNAEYYGANIPLEVAEDGPVRFWYDHKTRWVSDSVNSLFAAVVGEFQAALGCPEAPAAGCLRSLLTDPDGDGLYRFVTAAIPAGEYDALVALDAAAGETFGADGEAGGEPIPFAVAENQAVIFDYDPDTHLLEIATGDAALAQGAPAAEAGMPPPVVATSPEMVIIPGTIQSVLGCDGDWLADCEATALVFDDTFQLWLATFALPAGEYEYKAALNGTWDVNFGVDAQAGGENIPLVVDEDRDVTFLFSTQTGWVTDDVNTPIATVAGSFQDDIGCPAEWSPDCLRSWLQDPEGDGTFVFQTDAIPAGDYEAKVAVGLSWDENYGEAGAPGGANIAFNVPADGTLVTFVWNSSNKIMTIQAGGSGPKGNLSEARAHWLAQDTIVWDVEYSPDNTYTFHYTETGEPLVLDQDGVSGNPLTLTYVPEGLSEEPAARYPHLADYSVFRLPARAGALRIALKGQVAVAASAGGELTDATGLQIAGVLDDLYPYDGPLGVTYEDGAPVLRVWAPTAQRVRLVLFDDADPETPGDETIMRIDPETGVWTLAGEPEWDRKFYLYEVTVFAPSTGAVETNLVTDPYSVSLSINSGRSQIVNLDDADLKPEGWGEGELPPLAAPEDIVIYELHIRDFSIADDSVPADMRGTYGAFAAGNGATHLAGLAEAGVTHLHLLPSFDIATIDEDAAARVEPDPAALAALPPDSEAQQALIGETRDLDGFNWGYDPLHYNVPEGSYSTDPDGVARILEYRQMVQALNGMGLRVVADVVYNHTNASGQNDNSVLDRIVPGYYHRLSAAGRVETSTCCQNTATEHAMMRKLMVDSVRLWAEQYGVNAFRFDLMGHHMKDDMLAVRAALDEIDPSIYVYGEGWDFGEVAGNARGVNATQANMAGTGIGTFNDRLRDSARGGSPFGGQQEQGFITGLFVAPNETDQGPAEEQLARLLLMTDRVRVGLAGNLAAYEFTGASGETVRGDGIDYNGSSAGYTADPQENIIYVSKHDNETLFDAIQYKAPATVDLAGRTRMQNLGNSLVMLSQGVPFFQAGDDLLRSKSLDRNSYNSGDWFNAIDWTGQTTNWGRGLPPAADNESMWPVMAGLLANPDLAPRPEHIAAASAHYREMAQIRAGSPLFRLRTAEDVQARLRFLNTGPEQIPGLIVMSLSDTAGENLDPQYDRLVVLFNADDEAIVFTAAELAGREMALHPVLAASADPIVAGATWDSAAGAFTVPGRTTAVFVQAEGSEPAPTPAPTAEPTAIPTAAPTATAAPTSTAAPTATAVAVAVATAEAPPTPAEEEAAEAAVAPPAPAESGRSGVTAVAVLIIVGAVGAVAGIIAWLRGREAG